MWCCDVYLPSMFTIQVSFSFQYTYICSHAYMYEVPYTRLNKIVNVLYLYTCGRCWSEPLKSVIDLMKNTWISLFSDLVVRSRVVRESALLSHLALEKVKATIGSLSFFCSMLTRDNHMFLSCEEDNGTKSVHSQKI